MPDLWPKDLGAAIGTPPIKHLREQADYLTKRTNGELVGRVRTSKTNNQFMHSFEVLAPLLDNYSYTLFGVFHDINLYPATVQALVMEQQYQCPDEAAFLDILQRILGSPQAKRIIGSLTAQIEAEAGQP